MATPDPAIVAAYRRAFARLGVTVQVIFTRIIGVAPTATTATATVNAVVRNYQPDTESVARTEIPATKRGAVTQGDRLIIVMAADLAAGGFPLPLQKNDSVLLTDTGSTLNVIAADPFKRAAAGAIEVRASGIA